MRNITRLGAALVGVTLCLSGQALSVQAQSNPGDAALVGELVAFHGSKAIVSVMTTHCYETTGLDPAFKQAAEDWYLRNIGFLDLADRVVGRLGGAAPQEQQVVETYAGEQIMSAYNQAADKSAFCGEFLAKVEAGGFDIDQQLPGPLKRAQEIASQ